MKDKKTNANKDFDTDTAKKLSKLFDEQRKIKGWSLRQFAKEAKTTVPSLTFLKDNHITSNMANKCAAAFGYSSWYEMLNEDSDTKTNIAAEPMEPNGNLNDIKSLKTKIKEHEKRISILEKFIIRTK